MAGPKSDIDFDLFFGYGPSVPLEVRCDDCYTQVVLKSIYRLSWCDWGESGVAVVGATMKCENCGRKASSYWG